MASVVVIACFIMVIIFVTGWNKTVTGRGKQFKADPQRGPYGLPPGRKPDLPKATTKGEDAKGRAAVEPTPLANISLQPPDSAETTGALGTDDRTDVTQGNVYMAPEVLAAASDAASTRCTAPTCHTLKEWFVKLVEDQADPCEERHTFVCDASTAFPQFGGHPTKGMVSQGGDGDRNAAVRKASVGGEGAGNLTRLCVQYARDPAAGVQDILSFLSHFNLDLRRIEDDAKEDPVSRMMELSLEYGVDWPVSFTRKYDATGKASGPFLLQIDLNPEVDEFLGALERMNPESVKAFYELCLSHYALLNDTVMSELLLKADFEIADILNKTRGSSQLKKVTIGDLSNYTGIHAERWLELVADHGRFEAVRKTKVQAEQRALSLLAYLSRPGSQRLDMRRVLAWHVFRGLVAPKVELLQALNQTPTDENGDDDLFMDSPAVKCEGLVAKVTGVPFATLDLFEGEKAIPAEVIANVTGLMAEVQNAVSFVFRGTRKGSGPSAPQDVAGIQPSTKVTLFPKAWGQDAAFDKLFPALQGSEKVMEKERSFPRVWLRHLRAWHALPPLAQALLPTMASVENVDSPADFFRPPYYAGGSFQAYNFAALGQVVSQAVAHELFEQRRGDAVGSEQWKRLFDGFGKDEYSSTYCFHARVKQNDTWRQEKLTEKVFTDKGYLEHLLGTRTAQFAFVQHQRSNNRTDKGATAELPGVGLSKKQLFDVMHCALSCAMVGKSDHLRFPRRQDCMVVYKTAGRFIDRPCGKSLRVNALKECLYV